MKNYALLKCFALVAVALAVTGCGPSRNDIDAFLKPYEVNVTLDEYKLQPPDSITVSCSKVPQLNGVSQSIRADGKISFEMLGEFDAAGKTPKELADEITKEVKNLYALSDGYPLDVRIERAASKYYYVFGEVQRQGAMQFTGRVSALQALALNPPQITAWESEIKVIRPDGQPEIDPKTGKIKFTKEKIFKMNLDDMVKKGDTSRNVLLAEGDIIYVPPTPLAAVSSVLAEFVRPIGLALQPFNQYYSFQNMQNRAESGRAY